MYSSVVRRLIFLCALLALPGLALAQEATLTGTITDSTGGVLPGVTVRRRQRGFRQPVRSR